MNPSKRDPNQPRLPSVHAKKKRAKIIQDAWLERFKKRGTILGACTDTGVPRSTIQEWLNDPAFKNRMETADEEITDTLEASTMDHATAGGKDGKGIPVLKMFLLNARRPNKYRQNSKLTVEGKLGSSEDVTEMLRMLMHVLQSKIPDSCPTCKSLSTVKSEISDELIRLGKIYADTHPQANA